MATWDRAVAAFARELNEQPQTQLSMGKKTFLNYCLAVSEKCCIFANRKCQDMSKYEIPFLTAAVHAFGERFAMTRQAAFSYLHEHKGLAFLI